MYCFEEFYIRSLKKMNHAKLLLLLLLFSNQNISVFITSIRYNQVCLEFFEENNLFMKNLDEIFHE